MLLPRLFSAATLVLACVFQAPALPEKGEAGPKPIGAGGFPVSFVHASAWFAHRSDPQGKELTLMVYFEGTPGWHDQPTDFTWDINGNPARIEMSVGNTPIDVKYWPDTSALDIQGHKLNLSTANVFLVKNVEGPNTSVLALGHHDLSFIADENPAIALLRRSPPLRAALSGRTPTQESANPIGPGMEEAAGWDNEGLALLRSGNPKDDKKACELFRKAANKGYARAQYRLGYCYESGRGVKQDATVANQWYEQAANQGHVDAQYKLGHSYRVGRGTKIDLAKAVEWYKKAADNGDAVAQNNLGWMYAAGMGVEASAEQAFAWFQKAAHNGQPGSQYEVARRLWEGDGAERDLASAYAWALVVKAQSKRFSQSDWEQIQKVLHSIEAEVDEVTKVKAQKTSREWMRSLARQYVESLGGR